MSGTPVTLLVNPAAGRGRALRVASTARRALAAAGVDVRLVRTGVAPGAPHRPFPVQVGDPGRAIVVCGGDGTVAAALPALLDRADGGDPVPLGLVPAGTGNDFAGALGIPQDPAAAVTALIADLTRGVARRVDLGWVRPAPANHSHEGPAGFDDAAGDGATDAGRPFATVVACGFDSRVTARRNASRWPLGPLAYPAAVLAELSTLTPATYRLTVDGRARDVEAVLVAVGNTAAYGGGMRICPDAVVDDGLLDVTIVRAVSRATLLRVFPRVYSGGHRDHPAVELLSARSVTVRTLSAPTGRRAGPAVVPVHADGEPVVPLPVTCAVRPGALTVLGATVGVPVGLPGGCGDAGQSG